MSKWFKTDDLQICKHEKDGVYEFVEFNQADENMFLLSEQDKIIIANWKDSDGEWDADAIYYIECYYKSLDELRKLVRKEDEEQIVAEILYEQTSVLADDDPMTESEAEAYLSNFL